MRRVVVADDFAETEIRPPELVERYYELSRRECERFFDEATLETVPCPFCAGEGEAAFERWRFEYRHCLGCRSLFLSPRPTAESLSRYRAGSEATAVWNEVLSRTAQNRDERVFLPRLEWVANVVAETLGGPVGYADWHGRSLAYLEAVAGLPLFGRVQVLAPEPPVLEACRARGWIAEPSLGSSETFGAITVFDALNAEVAPGSLVDAVARRLEPGGLLFVTGRASGFEVQVLWEDAPHLHPLDHMNVPTIEGLERLLSHRGFSFLELSTPGQLDVAMIAGAAERHPALPLPRWLRYFLDHRGEADRRALQELLQRARLSSHFRLVARRAVPQDEVEG